jgi:hypothetical protein
MNNNKIMKKTKKMYSLYMLIVLKEVQRGYQKIRKELYMISKLKDYYRINWKQPNNYWIHRARRITPLKSTIMPNPL